MELDTELGSIAPGERADLLLVSAKPLAVSPEQIPPITVESTMVDGVRCGSVPTLQHELRTEQAGAQG